MFIANWKMNGSLTMLEEWLKGVGKTLNKSLQKQCLLCPPVCFLSEASNLISKLNLSISLGAQNIDPSSISSLTGGIDGSMLRSIGSEFVIIGHSERRDIFKEGDSLLLEKLKSASEEGLKVVFCIGESLSEKEQNQTLNILRQQLKIIKKVELNEFMIAYEPVWAIGTGNTANIDYIDKIHKEIIDEVTSYQKEGFLGICYGGSVDSSISKDILSIKGVQGLLIGGASLECEEFCNIVLTNNRN
ncbi:MAG: triose-phosphate isomerase [SAR86 cluster bacterium]|nr:triose-phosphate isomerase [SAR86 cluster bacterium]